MNSMRLPTSPQRFPLPRPIPGPRQRPLFCPHPLPRRSGPQDTLPLCSPATESTALPPLSEPTLPPWSAGEVRRVEPSVAAVLPSSSEAGAERVTRAVTGKNPSLGRKHQTTQRRGHSAVYLSCCQRKKGKRCFAG